MRPLLNYALPVVSVMTLIEMGRVHLALGDSTSARTAMRRADAILRQRPCLGVLGRELDELHAEFDAASGVTAQRHKPGLECMMPPSAKIVVAVR